MDWTYEVNRDGKTTLMKFDTGINRAMTSQITTSDKGIYPNAQDIVIKEGIKRYFTTLRDKNRRVALGKERRHNEKMVRYSRKKRKLENRRNAVSFKTSWDGEKKARVNAILSMEVMSSEDQIQSDGEAKMKVKKLPWRSDECERLLGELDRKHNDRKTTKSRKMELKLIS